MLLNCCSKKIETKESNVIRFLNFLLNHQYFPQALREFVSSFLFSLFLQILANQFDMLSIKK